MKGSVNPHIRQLAEADGALFSGKILFDNR